VSLHRADVA